ncbi:hypothetical protein GJ744_010211 [Endocarpon pusillum]|uniref:Uncharacterized protein n=1 Tax=Endocarpon pusillum TaxID=364733 RepID=A0A8H7E4B3_9EURO|nr:hypothetical protein GJ744_010211 [Endocarpon pusillum]
MHGAMGMSGSCRYRKFSGEPEPLIYKDPAPSFAWIQQLFLPEIKRADIYFFPFTVSIFFVAHKRFPRDDGTSLLPTAFWEVQSVSS